MERDGNGWRERAIRDAVLAGDSTAWRAWYDEHFAPLAEYIRWRCGGLPELADDVIQETWLTAVRRLRSFDPTRGAFFAWLCGIASNALRNAVRGRRRLKKRSRPLAGADPHTPEPDPAAVEKAERTAAALAALPAHYEAVLRAKYLDRLTVEQIAAGQGVSVKGIESLLSRARQAFREAYEATDG
ncbi:MAG TPA: sigma-70 family RNA polymerase sigma factor [Gemmataceae bacterium]|nr:sigma-70 family RNA polymerase sigma factor [Gemmataceae bacterium]